MSEQKLRMYIGFAILLIIEFGLIYLAVYNLIIWKPWTTLAICAIAWFSGLILPKPIAWLTTIGMRKEYPNG